MRPFSRGVARLPVGPGGHGQVGLFNVNTTPRLLNVNTWEAPRPWCR